MRGKLEIVKSRFNTCRLRHGVVYLSYTTRPGPGTPRPPLAREAEFEPDDQNRRDRPSDYFQVKNVFNTVSEGQRALPFRGAALPLFKCREAAGIFTTPQCPFKFTMHFA